MGFRITTWNVNGIRNPFGYQPWSSKKTFAAMFEILEADIVVMQECKIQRKDLKDDMVLVPGWDVFFSLPQHKKGYSGVAIYTRNAKCAPIRAEEGITGLLCPRNPQTSYCNLPEENQIGGYPTPGQLSDCEIEAALLDSEGRCMILEFPAFVLIGVYFPANSTGDRDDFRISFMIALDVRIRNLVALGKKVVLTGDLNVIREEIDTPNAEEQMRKNGIIGEDFVSVSPIRRIFNHLLVDGKVIGARDEGREKGVLWDLCRLFHPDRKGMYTCWEQKINARPGNFGSRIDYVLCSDGWTDWFCESNIQEGLMGSDHCPAYAVIKDKVEINHTEVHTTDIMNPEGMFKDGVRLREWCQKDVLPASARLIPEFDRRRNIRDMFNKKPALAVGESSSTTSAAGNAADGEELNSALQAIHSLKSLTAVESSLANIEDMQPSSTSQTKPPKSFLPLSFSKANGKVAAPPVRPSKRSKPYSNSAKTTPSTSRKAPEKGQSSLMGFFKPKAAGEEIRNPNQTIDEDENPTSSALHVLSTSFPNPEAQDPAPTESLYDNSTASKRKCRSSSEETTSATSTAPLPAKPDIAEDDKDVIDPTVARESWSKLLSKRVVPRCEHDEPCVSMLTKKPGVNCGRSFFVCPRPMGPSGVKEKGTEWRCSTFIWSSDWTKSDAR